MKQEELQEKILEWGHNKGLLKYENHTKQYIKFITEAGELGDAIIGNGSIDDIVDAIGDVQVTLIILASQLGLNYDICLETAYNVIKNRTGKTVNGTFIKD